MIISPVDTSDIEWSSLDGDIYPALLQRGHEGVTEQKVDKTTTQNSYRKLDAPHRERIRGKEYLGGEAYTNAISYRGFLDRTLVLLHTRMRGKS